MSGSIGGCGSKNGCTETTKISRKWTDSYPRKPSRFDVWMYRSIYLTMLGCLVIWCQDIQTRIDAVWTYLLDTSFFTHVTFETAWTMLLDIPISVSFFVMTKLPFLKKYKIDPTTPGWRHLGIKNVIIEGIQYAYPLLFLDFVTIKKYCGVDPSQWDERRKFWIQSTRALPLEPPTVFQICFHILGAFVLFDIFFCFLHYILHKNAWLYKNIHSPHHNHDVLYSKVVNQLSTVERILLILSANGALKLMGAHPLTRTIFVPLFLIALTENHCGYALPWSLDTVVPFGLIGGSVRHWAHHVKGDRYYAPFFTVLDDYVLKKKLYRE